MFLLDTNICIDFVDGRNERARRRVVERLAGGLSVSSITAAELLVGARHSIDPREDKLKIEQFLTIVRPRDFDEAAARSYAQIVEMMGVQRRSFDRLIAAHALSLGLPLVTNNERHFADVPGLRIENWTIA